ncbi:alpha/beta fold hydrolase [Hydrogenophaga sp.]|uniref:alpha/beta fold hydrolase n=1 Tax=Hydrogenophaga sp. TaxID=1904254 RepID=UPI002715FDCF|nr:alpha/beta hydrolase [Hydrogenophaga sp.]MDO8906287.1 alpha/beta hydrolase [Hydrogenophaga sp.]
MTDHFDSLSWENRTVIVPGEGVLWSEATGPVDGLPVLLIMGAMNPGLVWPPGFVRALVEGGCRVLRYDHRDTGRSFVSDPARPPYTLDAFTSDGLRVLDAWGLGRVAVVGWSMGGYIAQQLARGAPQRVSHLVLLGSTADHRPYMAGVMGRPAPDADLPGPAPGFVERLWALSAQAGKSSPEDSAVLGWEIFHGGSWPFPHDRVRTQMRQALANGHRPEVALRHAQAVGLSPPRTAWLPDLRVPTLVLHGAHDPCLPLPHGEALAHLIPGAKLEVLDMGHILPEALEDVAARSVLQFICPDKAG